MHQIELDGFGAAQALDHADGDRKEAEIGRDEALGISRAGSVGMPNVPVKILKPMTTISGAMARIGNGLAGDDPGHQRAVDRLVVDDERRQGRCRAALPMRKPKPVAEKVTQAWKSRLRGLLGATSMVEFQSSVST